MAYGLGREGDAGAERARVPAVGNDRDLDLAAAADVVGDDVAGSVEQLRRATVGLAGFVFAHGFHLELELDETIVVFPRRGVQLELVFLQLRFLLGDERREKFLGLLDERFGFLGG